MVDLVKARKKANEKKAELAQLKASASPVHEVPPAHTEAELKSAGVEAATEESKGEKLEPIQEQVQSPSIVPGRALRRLDEIKAALGTKRIFSSSENAGGGQRSRLLFSSFCCSRSPERPTPSRSRRSSRSSACGRLPASRTPTRAS